MDICCRRFRVLSVAGRAPLAVSERRSRSVSFRLSEQEYKTLAAECEAQGARCVSEGVRNVIHSLLGVRGRENGVRTRSNTKSETKVEDTLVELQGRLEELESDLKLLTTAVRRLLQADSRAEEPRPSTTAPNSVRDCGLVQLTDAVGQAPRRRAAADTVKMGGSRRS